MDKMKELGETPLEAVTGGARDPGVPTTPPGIYRCARCGWEWPKKVSAIPHMYPCKKCGGPLLWHEDREE